jgi:hemoglobin/transferrin/lactoferrin receptor protein
MISKIRLFFCFIVMSICMHSSVHSQDTEVKLQKVRVVNGSIPIPFVAVINISTSEQVISDADGIVFLPFRNPSDTLVFRSMGYEQVIILPGQIIGKFLPMYESPVSLEEVQILSNVVPDVASDLGLKRAATLGATAIKNGVPPGNTAELLQSSGQIHVQQSQQGGGSPVLRGFEANRVLLVVDGVRMNNAIYRSGHLHNAITVDPNSLEQIQVILGPNSVRFGSDALGGVVHFQTRRPRFRSNSSESNYSGLFSAQYRTVNNSYNLHAAAEAGGPRWGTVISFSQSEFGDLSMGSWRAHGDSAWGLVPLVATRINGVDSLISNSDPEKQSPTGYSQNDFLYKLRLGIPGGAIETNFQYSKSSNIPRFDKLNDFSGDSLKWAEWNYGPQARLMAAVTWEQYLGIPGSLHTTFAFQQISESRIKRLFGSPFRTIQEEQVEVLSMSSIWKSSPFRGDGWKFEAGLDGQLNDVVSTVKAQDPEGEDIIDPGFGGELMTRYPNGGSSMSSFGAFTSAKRSLGDRVFHLGLRYSYSSYDAKFIPTSALQLPFSEVNSGHGALTGSLAAEIPLCETISSISSLSSGFRHPNIDDAVKVREKGGYVLVPNDSLKAEYLYSLDESITWRHPSSDFSVSLAGFISLWTDIITPVNSTLNGETTLVVDGTVSIIQRNENSGNAIIRGARIEVYAPIMENMNFSSLINFTKGYILTSNSPVAHIPPTFGRTALEYSQKKWSIEAYVLYNGAKHIDDYGSGSTDNVQEALEDGTPSWWTLNLESHIIFNDHLHAQFGLSNILDMHYKSFASGISAPGRGAYIALHAIF